MRTSRAFKSFLAVAVLIAIAGAGALVFWPQIFSAIEEERIWQTKASHWHHYADGKLPLPGTPDLGTLDKRLEAIGAKLGSPILMRVFKREFEVEVWVKRDDGFVRFATYPICMWSGDLGPKLKQGDGQAPEGFYTVDAKALNPNSKYHRSFNLGFPNAYDRAHGRTGSLLMMHGDCRSIGCYAMTDPVIDEIWTLVTAALGAGQKQFQVQAFPFRMTERNMSWRSHDAQAQFWKELKAGYDLFEKERVPPIVNVCNRSYAFRSGLDANGPKDGSEPIADGCPAQGASGGASGGQASRGELDG
jgi:murein L,D-transpeptidase YafK